MKFEFRKADPVKEAWGLTRVDKQCYPKDWWTQAEWRQYDQVYWTMLNEENIGCLAMGRDMAFSCSEDDRAWVKSGSLYLATTSILPKYRTRSISNAVRRWQIQFAKDRGYDMISTNCRESDTWYRELCARFDFEQVGDVPYFAKPHEENTIVFRLKLR